jgi:hypothetical protein
MSTTTIANGDQGNEAQTSSAFSTLTALTALNSCRSGLADRLLDANTAASVLIGARATRAQQIADQIKDCIAQATRLERDLKRNLHAAKTDYSERLALIQDDELRVEQVNCTVVICGRPLAQMSTVDAADMRRALARQAPELLDSCAECNASK